MRREHVPLWMVAMVPLFITQSPLSAERVRGKCGRGKSVLILHSVVWLCGAASCCRSGVGGIHAPVLSACFTLLAGIGAVSGGRVLTM